MLTTWLGSEMLVKPMHSAKVWFPIPVRLSGSETPVRDQQLANAALPMLVTLLGIVTLVRLLHDWKAELPMLVTGSPAIVLGIATAPPGPVYAVMVTAPFVIM
jgi:hypothetical protein